MTGANDGAAAAAAADAVAAEMIKAALDEGLCCLVVPTRVRCCACGGAAER